MKSDKQKEQKRQQLLEDALKHLRRILKEGPKDYSKGLCNQSASFAMKTCVGERVTLLVRQWAEENGRNILYPIEGTDLGYFANERKWDVTTPHGKARWNMVEELVVMVERKLELLK